jgi:RNA polymerase sigma-70 factor (ECF subfamily)
MAENEEILVLVERARQGDNAAYGALVDRFQPTVYGVALARLHNAVEAQELTQEVFMHGLLKLPQLRDARCFAGWLLRIAVRKALNRLSRRRLVRGGESEALENAPAAGAGPLEELVRAEQRVALWRGLDRLKGDDRAVLVAFYIQGRSLKQISREFQAPVGTIKRRLHVARKRLRRQLEGAGRAREPMCV